MKPYYEDPSVTLFHGNCLEVLRELPDASVDSVVTDPPYGLSNTDPAHVVETITRWVSGDREYLPGGKGFMGKAWDAFVPPVAVWDECLRVLKPGGHVLAFAGSRTYDLMTLGLRLAGFDIRDGVAWLYGSGFPKSMNVSRAIDGALGVEGSFGEPKSAAHAAWIDRGRMRGDDGNEGWQRPWMKDEEAVSNAARTYVPGSPEAQEFDGWGTALKPAFEPIVMARKPFPGTVAGNVLAHGTGALNIDGCRSETRDRTDYGLANAVRSQGDTYGAPSPSADFDASKGRWPANVILDESQAAALDEQSGKSQSRVGKPRGADSGEGWGMTATGAEYDDIGGASRFFFTAKASADERVRVNGVAHPTVKPLAVKRWLVRLITPPGGTVVDPFVGSGTTAEACLLEGLPCIVIEREADYLPLILQRLNRRRDPVAAVKAIGEDGGLFDLLDGAP